MGNIREKIKIRGLEKGDVTDVLDLLKNTGLFFEPSDTREAYERMIEHDPQSVLVMTHDESIIGMVIIVYSPLLSVLYHLCVDPESQREGLGSVLILEAERVIRDLGGSEDITAYVKADNAASLSMFSNLGFKTYPVPVVCTYKDSELSQ